MVNELSIETIVLFLRELPRKKEYNTPSIELARGKFKYKNTWFNRIKKLIHV
jgi:hypothetical protein